jgi:hypothetical protein
MWFLCTKISEIPTFAAYYELVRVAVLMIVTGVLVDLDLPVHNGGLGGVQIAVRTLDLLRPRRRKDPNDCAASASIVWRDSGGSKGSPVAGSNQEGCDH